MEKLRKETDITYEKICSYPNLFIAYQNARKRKTLKPYVIEFEKELCKNLIQLQKELEEETYKPRPLETFILRDPKTRKISKSDFRDRVIHHAVCNIIEPIFDNTFIYDSYANRAGKGTLKAIEHFNKFKRKASKNQTRDCYFLKADIKHYFETVDHEILIRMLRRKIKDEKIISLINKILQNYKEKDQLKATRRGMPLGNLTSQFFANVYLNELDQYVKHKLNAKYYLRYVDDFIILDYSIDKLREYKQKIDTFLMDELHLQLHPDKSKIIKLERGANFLGFRIFYHHKLIRKKNLRKFDKKFNLLKIEYKRGNVERDEVIEKFEGWIAYVSNANTFKYRRHLARELNKYFPIAPPPPTIRNIKKHENHVKRTEASDFQFSPKKTFHLFKKGLNIKQIAEQRRIKEGTVWEHLARLIEFHQCKVQEILPKEKIERIRKNIFSQNEFLKEIKQRLNDETITYDEINCVLASIKSRYRTKNIIFHSKGYQRNHCYRKCYVNPIQRKQCKAKFDEFIKQNPTLELQRKAFIDLFNNHIKICILDEKEKRRFMTWKEFKENNRLNTIE